MSKKKLFPILIIFALLLMSCGPAATPQTVIQTVEVEKTVEVVKTVEVPVEKTVVVQPTAAPSEKIKIRFANWGGTEEFTAKLFQQFIDDFQSSHPDIQVESVPIPFLQYTQQLTVMIAAGDAPDVIQSYVLFTPIFQGMGALAPLDKYFSADELKDIMEVDSGRYGKDKTLYAITWSPAIGSMFYDKDLLKQAGYDPTNPPVEWNDWVGAIKKITALGKDIHGLCLTSSKEPSAYFWVLPYLWDFGGDVWDKDGNVIINNEAGINWATWLQEMNKNGWITPGIDATEARNVFSTGKCGFFSDGPWGKGLFESASGKKFDDAFGIMPWPKPKIGGNPKIPSATHQLIVTSQSKHPDAAAEFVKFLLSDSTQKAYYTGTTLLPASSSIWTSWDTLQTPYMKQILTYMPDAYNPPFGTQWLSVSDFIMGGLEQIYAGADVKITLNSVAESIKTVAR
jgi:ABC-type glycerol-3-phosphate transport system substrate-binding protein